MLLRYTQHFVSLIVAVVMALAIGYTMTIFTWAQIAQWGTAQFDDAYMRETNAPVTTVAASTLRAPLAGDSPRPSPSHHCGTERWPVKTLADPDAARISEQPIASTVAQLTAGDPMPRSTLLNDARLAAELHTYLVTAYVGGFKLEGDSDFHIVTVDLDKPAKTMVNEMPDPACVPEEYRVQMAALRNTWEKRFGKATTKYKDLHQHRIRVQFVGVGFYDFIHGQTGVAKNGFELHPILAWQEVFATMPAPDEARAALTERDSRVQFLPILDPAFRRTELVYTDPLFLPEHAPALCAVNARAQLDRLRGRGNGFCFTQFAPMRDAAFHATEFVRADPLFLLEAQPASKAFHHPAR